MRQLSEATRQSIKQKQEQRELERRKGIISRIMRRHNCSLQDACGIHASALIEQHGSVPATIASQLETIQREAGMWNEKIGMIG